MQASCSTSSSNSLRTSSSPGHNIRASSMDFEDLPEVRYEYDEPFSAGRLMMIDRCFKINNIVRVYM